MECPACQKPMLVSPKDDFVDATTGERFTGLYCPDEACVFSESAAEERMVKAEEDAIRAYAAKAGVQ